MAVNDPLPHSSAEIGAAYTAAVELLGAINTVYRLVSPAERYTALSGVGTLRRDWQVAVESLPGLHATAVAAHQRVARELEVLSEEQVTCAGQTDSCPYRLVVNGLYQGVSLWLGFCFGTRDGVRTELTDEDLESPPGGAFFPGFRPDFQPLFARLRTQAINAGEQRREKLRRKRRSSVRPRGNALTALQREAYDRVERLGGNIARAARELGRDRKTVEQHYRAAQAKLADSGLGLPRPKKRKPKSRALPRDRRGQVLLSDVYRDEFGQDDDDFDQDDD